MALFQMSKKIEGLVCLTVGIVGAFICLFNFYTKTVFILNAVKGYGTIVSIKVGDDEKNPYDLFVKFTPLKSQPQTYVFVSRKVRPVGEEFKILYNAGNPQDVRSEDAVHREYVYMMIFFTVCCLLIPMGWVRIKYSQKLFGFF